jgi:hypothetical protein
MSASLLKQTSLVLACLIAITFMFITSSYTSHQPGKVKVDGGWIQGTVEIYL